MTEGPATATANVPAPLAPMAMSPARPADSARPRRPLIAPAARSSPDGEGPGDVGELVRAVQLGAQAGAGGPVGQLHLDLGDPEALAQQVDGERGLHSPAARQRAPGLERRPSQAALAV